MAKQDSMNNPTPYVFLNDGETFTNLEGSTLVFLYGKGYTVAYDLSKIVAAGIVAVGISGLPDAEAEVTDKMLYELESATGISEEEDSEA